MTVDNNVSKEPIHLTKKQACLQAAGGMLALAAAVSLVAIMVINAQSVALNEALQSGAISLPAFSYGVKQVASAFILKGTQKLGI